MSASAVQFRGTESTVNAYGLNKTPAWALKNGNQLLFSYAGVSMDEGADELREFLELLEKGGSEAKYTLCVYELKTGEKILSNTPYYRSFNFSLFDPTTSPSPYYQARNGMVTKVDERMAVMEKQMAFLIEKMTEEQEEPKQVSGIGAMLNGLMEIPEFQQAIVGRVIGLFDKIIPMGKKEIPGRVAGTEPTGSILPAEQVEKVNQALAVLCTKDEKLGDHLLAVANLAQNNPVKYKMALAML